MNNLQKLERELSDIDCLRAVAENNLRREILGIHDNVSLLRDESPKVSKLKMTKKLKSRAGRLAHLIETSRTDLILSVEQYSDDSLDFVLEKRGSVSCSHIRMCVRQGAVCWPAIVVKAIAFDEDGRPCKKARCYTAYSVLDFIKEL